MLTWLRRLSARRSWWKFLSDGRGVAAVEFAFIAPTLLLMLLAAPDISSAIMASNRATYVAESLGQLVSQTKIKLSDTDLSQILNSAPLIDPDILTYARQANVSISNSASIIITSVAFTLADANCKSNCQYNANTVFSSSLSGGARPCGRLQAGDGEDLGTLPAKVYSANSLIVLDVVTRFRPLLSNIFFGEMSFKRTSYFRPRYLDQIDSTKNCPGYAS